jgi:hypothetical protein
LRLLLLLLLRTAAALLPRRRCCIGSPLVRHMLENPIRLRLWCNRHCRKPQHCTQ